MPAPFDGRFKILAEDFPWLLVRLFGIVEPGTKPELIHVLRELHLDPMQIDHVYRIGGETDGRLVHFEAITSWPSQRTSTLALYRLLLPYKYKLPVRSFLVLMAEKYAPKTLPACVVYEEPDGVRVEAPYEVIRLWEINPEIAFEPECRALLPWVPTLKGGMAEFERARDAIDQLFAHPQQAPYPVETTVINLAVLATLKYDKGVVKLILEGLRKPSMLSTDLFADTWLYKDGVAAGKAEGKAEGKVEGKRESLRLAVNRKFPNLSAMPELDQITSIAALDGLLIAIFDAQTADDVRAALNAASHAN